MMFTLKDFKLYSMSSQKTTKSISCRYILLSDQTQIIRSYDLVIFYKFVYINIRALGSMTIR